MNKAKVVPAFLGILSLLFVGSFAYQYLEGWSFIDSLYFTSVTITTVGYGDLHPSSDISKVFTIVLALSGVAIGLYSLSILGHAYYEEQEDRITQMRERIKAERDRIEQARVQLEREEAKLRRQDKFRSKKFGF